MKKLQTQLHNSYFICIFALNILKTSKIHETENRLLYSLSSTG